MDQPDPPLPRLFLTTTDRPPLWMAEGRCRQTDPELFFPEQGERNDTAKSICARCPVIDQCLEHALRFDEEGIWGGTSVKERAAIRRHRRKTARINSDKLRTNSPAP